MTCEKIKYNSYSEANSALAAIGRNERRGMMAYKCNDCGGFHLATKGKKKKLRLIKDWSYQTRVKNWSQSVMPKVIEKKEPVYATEKLLSKDQAKALKRLIEGNKHLIPSRF